MSDELFIWIVLGIVYITIGISAFYVYCVLGKLCSWV